tara:strand:- start:227 stop:634 length:408 start_codon:yes stop_codon:yes gene_type:complete
MAEFVLSNAFLSVNSVDLSAYVTSITISQSADSVEDTSMGDTARSYIGGLTTGTLDISFNQDFAAAKTEATIYPLIGTTTTCVVRPTAAAVGTTNPSYTATVLVTEWTSVEGSVGDLATATVSWPITGNLVKATS